MHVRCWNGYCNGKYARARTLGGQRWPFPPCGRQPRRHRTVGPPPLASRCTRVAPSFGRAAEAARPRDFVPPPSEYSKIGNPSCMGDLFIFLFVCVLNFYTLPSAECAPLFLPLPWRAIKAGGAGIMPYCSMWGRPAGASQRACDKGKLGAGLGAAGWCHDWSLAARMWPVAACHLGCFVLCGLRCVLFLCVAM